MGDVRRTRSLIALPSYVPTSYRVPSSPALYTVRRVVSLPSLYSSYPYYSSYHSYVPYYKYSSPDYYYRPSYNRYYRDWDLNDDYWSDRRYYTGSRYWPYYGWPYRKYFITDLDRYYPSSAYYYRPWYYSSYLSDYTYDRPRYLARYYYDYFDTWYWKRRLDPYWYRPWSSSLSSSSSGWPYYSRPWAYESAEFNRAWDMYRKGMIGYDTMNRYYLSPSTCYHQYSDYLKPYTPPISYSSYPHYMYSIDYR